MASYEKVKKRAKGAERDSYLQYLAREGIENPKNDLADERVKIQTAASFDAPEYGTAGEELARGGLSDDGYAGYLERLVKDRTNLGYARAYHKSRLAEYRARGGYGRYLERYDAAQERIAQSILEKIKKERIFDSTAAISLAVKAGLSPENAEITVSRGIASGRQEAIRDVIEYAQKNGFYAYTAKLHALNTGLDEGAAEIVYNAIRSKKPYDSIDYGSLTPEEYMKLLEERAERRG